ncbi:Pirin-1 [Tetrabaena socialis]|uniref:Pirin-1 n=1 Tax=Tetrabaena socialis TaxID=47790 RepID=A0A2J8AI88_9CHLO|nr:Pirin-1 [Tetrabaena socialis]|eukprot:PNH12230.1 Pirin-1 [Tetrabaena socialis]
MAEGGGVQWMTAGRGIVHSGTPGSTDGMIWGFQLWINLPKKDKMCKPQYQDYQATDIPVVESAPGASVRVMAGEHAGMAGPIKMRNPGLLMDVRLAAGANFTQEVSQGWNGFAYIYEGGGKVCGTKAQPEQTMVLGPGDHVVATRGSGPSGLKFLLIAGKPIGEPIVQHGPFVMNTQEEIEQAFRDYRSGVLQSPQDNPWTDDEP